MSYEDSLPTTEETESTAELADLDGAQMPEFAEEEFFKKLKDLQENPEWDNTDDETKPVGEPQSAQQTKPQDQ